MVKNVMTTSTVCCCCIHSFLPRCQQCHPPVLRCHRVSVNTGREANNIFVLLRKYFNSVDTSCMKGPWDLSLENVTVDQTKNMSDQRTAGPSPPC